MTAREELHAAFVNAMQDGNWHMTADEDHAKATAMVGAAIDEALKAAAEKQRATIKDFDLDDHWAVFYRAEDVEKLPDLIDPDKQETT